MSHIPSLEGSWKHSGMQDPSPCLSSFHTSDIPRNKSWREGDEMAGGQPLHHPSKGGCISWKARRLGASQSLTGIPPSRAPSTRWKAHPSPAPSPSSSPTRLHRPPAPGQPTAPAARALPHCHAVVVGLGEAGGTAGPPGASRLWLCSDLVLSLENVSKNHLSVNWSPP